MFEGFFNFDVVIFGIFMSVLVFVNWVFVIYIFGNGDFVFFCNIVFKCFISFCVCFFYLDDFVLCL